MKDRQRRGAILRENWREHFELFVNNFRGAEVYVTIDLDCLCANEAVTNWESGRFTIVDLEWALAKLRDACRIVAGDICGAFSKPTYARWKQRLASDRNHLQAEFLQRPAPGKLLVTQEELNLVSIVNPDGTSSPLNTLVDLSGANVIPVAGCGVARSVPIRRPSSASPIASAPSRASRSPRLPAVSSAPIVVVR